MVVSSVEELYLQQGDPVYNIPNTPGHTYVVCGNKYDYLVENCAVLDECNFGKVASKDLQGVQGQMMKLYESTKSRQQTRFSYRNGRVRGMMILVSSKRSDLDFLDNYIQKVKGNEGVYIVDEPVWNVRPKEEFSQIFKDRMLSSQKNVFVSKIHKKILFLKRILINTLCCLIPIKKYRKAIRKRFNVSTQDFNR